MFAGLKLLIGFGLVACHLPLIDIHIIGTRNTAGLTTRVRFKLELRTSLTSTSFVAENLSAFLNPPPISDSVIMTRTIKTLSTSVPYSASRRTPPATPAPNRTHGQLNAATPETRKSQLRHLLGIASLVCIWVAWLAIGPSSPGHSDVVISAPKIEKPLVIAVMGMTGVGKSTFIKELTKDANISIGHTLESCRSPPLKFVFTIKFQSFCSGSGGGNPVYMRI